MHKIDAARILAAAVTVILAAIPAAAQRKPARPQVPRPDGPVWEVIQENCISCHGIDDYAFFALDKAGWEKLLDAKHREPRIVLKDSDKQLLVAWLAEKFGPATKPFPRTYVPQEISEFFSDPEANRLLNRACTKCHGLDRVENQRNPE